MLSGLIHSRKLEATPFHFYIKVKEKSDFGKSMIARVGPTAACRRPERSPTLNQTRHTTQTQRQR